MTKPQLAFSSLGCPDYSVRQIILVLLGKGRLPHGAGWLEDLMEGLGRGGQP